MNQKDDQEGDGSNLDLPSAGTPRSAHFNFNIELLSEAESDETARDREWLRVYRHFTPRLSSFFQARVETQVQLDELIAEIWRRALLNVHSLRSPRAAWTWLTTIGVNLLRDMGRDRIAARRRYERFEVYLPDPVETQTILDRLAEDAFDGRVERSSFAARLALLSSEDHELLRLYAVEELPHEDIAILLKLPSAAASRQRLRRIREALRGE